MKLCARKSSPTVHCKTLFAGWSALSAASMAAEHGWSHHRRRRHDPCNHVSIHFISLNHTAFLSPSGSGPTRVLWVLLSSTLKPSSLTLDILSPPPSIFTLTRHQHRSLYPSSVASRQRKATPAVSLPFTPVLLANLASYVSICTLFLLLILLIYIYIYIYIVALMVFFYWTWVSIKFPKESITCSCLEEHEQWSFEKARNPF